MIITKYICIFQILLSNSVILGSKLLKLGTRNIVSPMIINEFSKYSMMSKHFDYFAIKIPRFVSFLIVCEKSMCTQRMFACEKI